MQIISYLSQFAWYCLRQSLKFMSNEVSWDNANAEMYLRELGGSKPGAYGYLQDTQPHLHGHLPTGTKFLESGEDIDRFLKGYDCNVPKVVRGCHWKDVSGMVDVVPTEIDVLGKESVRENIFKVLDAAQDKDVKSFVEYESGEKFHGDIGVLVQDFCGSERGSIIEHPHQKGVFRICHVMPIWGSRRTDLEEAVFDEQGREIPRTVVERTRNSHDGDQSISANLAERIIRLYRNVQDSGLMPSSHSFQMEFGVHDRSGEIMFYQSRLFRPYSPRADFDPLEFDGGKALTPHTFRFDAFGITSDEGEELSVAELDSAFVDKYQNAQKMAYGYNAYGNRCSTSLDVRPHNLRAFLPYGFQILEHGYYRWMQKAAIALVGVRRGFADRSRHPHIYGEELDLPVQEIDEQVRIRVISNGVSGVVARIED